jgi:chemotaxis protein CheY-P-specific phosphatase CheC
MSAAQSRPELLSLNEQEKQNRQTSFDDLIQSIINISFGGLVRSLAMIIRNQPIRQSM